jgi:hypothetical protein
MSFFHALMIVALVCFNGAGAILIGTTEDGRKVLLKEDGSWKFATTSDLTAVKTMQSRDAATGSAKPEGQKEDASAAEARVQMKSNSQEEPERADFLDVVKGDGTFDVRKANWGMDKAEVKKTESLQLIRETPTTVEYKFKLIGLESKIVYKFTQDKTGKARLSAAQYNIDQDDVNPARFYDDYKALKKYLRGLFGSPVSDENNWTNEIYKADEKNWGFAISLGFLTCKATWKNTRTKSVLQISGANHILSTNIEYVGAQ